MKARCVTVAAALVLTVGCGDDGSGATMTAGDSASGGGTDGQAESGIQTTGGPDTDSATSSQQTTSAETTSAETTSTGTTSAETTGGSRPDFEPVDPVVGVQVVAGRAHTCAVSERGVVRCWGGGTARGLGYVGTCTSPCEMGQGQCEDVMPDCFVGDDETPTEAGIVDVGQSVVQLAANEDHTCGLTDTGTVRCWGDGARGRLGYGDLEDVGDDETPADVGDIAVGGVVNQIAAGATHTCALLSGGAVRCWGDGRDGQLGYGNTEDIGDDELPQDAGDVSLGAPATRIAAGWLHTCALTDEGAVRCWGRGPAVGQGLTLVGERIGDDELPSSVGDVDIGGVAVDVFSSGAVACALLDTGGVRCWGEGSHGTLGYGNAETIGDDEPPAAGGAVLLTGSVQRVAMGNRHVCAVLDTGALRCWGWNDRGQLGYGDNEHIGDDEPMAAVGTVDLDAPVLSVGLGSHHSCAVLEGDRVRCWGSNSAAQLGAPGQYPLSASTPTDSEDVDLGG